MNLPLPILADSREQRPFAFAGYPATVETATLAAGDYSLRGFGSRIALERKTLDDLIGCLSRDRERFTRELARLRGHDFAAVIVESPLVELRQHRYLSAMDAGAAWQSCLALSQRYRVPFWVSETSSLGLSVDQAGEWLAALTASLDALAGRGLPVRGICWYSRGDQYDWDTALTVPIGTVTEVGLFDAQRHPRPVAQHYATLARRHSLKGTT